MPKGKSRTNTAASGASIKQDLDERLCREYSILNVAPEGLPLFLDPNAPPPPAKPPPKPPPPSQTFLPPSVLPDDFPNLFRPDLVLPLVRDLGVKQTLNELAALLGLKDHTINLIEFWFVDMLADCLWRVQDEYALPNDLQRVVILWIIYFVDILRDKRMNYNHDEVFSIFREMVTLAGEYMSEGDPWLPTPQSLGAPLTIEDMHMLNEQEEEEEEQLQRESMLLDSISEFDTASVIPDEDEDAVYFDLRGRDDKRHIFLIDDDDISDHTSLQSYQRVESVSSCTCSMDSLENDPRILLLMGYTNESVTSVSKISRVDVNEKKKPYPGANASDTRRIVSNVRRLLAASNNSIMSTESEELENTEIKQLNKRAMLAVIDCIFE